MIRYYLNLQFKRLQRQITDFGINAIFGMVIIIALFFVISFYLLKYQEYGEWIYLAILLWANSTHRSDIKLKCLQPLLGLRKVRELLFFESLFYAAPFILFFILFQQWEVLIVALMGIILVQFIPKSNSSFQVLKRTPFSNQPFEFATGFRRNILWYLISYSLSVIAFLVDNYNLGLFPLLILALLNTNFYSTIENEYYVWVHTKSPSEFLFQKIKIASYHYLIGIIPIVILSLLMDFGNSYILLLLGLFGLLLIVCNMMIKYAYFPSKIEVIQGTLLPLILLFPPLILFLLPYFYSRAKINLKTMLSC